MSTAELAASYAALILADEGIAITVSFRSPLVDSDDFEPFPIEIMRNHLITRPSGGRAY